MPSATSGVRGPGRLQGTADDLWCLLRKQGWKAPLSEMRDLLRRRFYMTDDELIVRKELAPSGEQPASTIRMELAEPRHLPALATFNRRQCNTRRTRRFATALAQGKRGVLGFRDGELIGYFWWTDATQPADRQHMSRLGIRLADDDVYGFDLFIDPAHRGHGVPAEFLANVESELARLGHRRMYGCVDSDNLPARWLYTTRGYETVQRARTRTVLKRLVLVDGTAWLSGRNGMRPLSRPTVAGGRR
jgi:GNAT superfamily N-acetyltransferase